MAGALTVLPDSATQMAAYGGTDSTMIMTMMMVMPMTTTMVVTATEKQTVLLMAPRVGLLLRVP